MAGAVHHLGCASMRPRGGLGGRIAPDRFVSHCLLVERDEGLLLVDTGFGTGDLADPTRLGRPFLVMLRPALDPAETAVARLRALGHDPADVTDIVLTHLDLDHAGGLADFPRATVHVDGTELDAALRPSLRERARYVAGQWAHGPRWRRYDAGGDLWLGFAGARAIGDDVVLVPLRGHSRGHCGVAVRCPDGGWLLHAGDSFYDARETATPPECLPGLRAFQRFMAVDEGARRANQQRLRKLRASGDVDVFCSHAAADLDRFAVKETR